MDNGLTIAMIVGLLSVALGVLLAVHVPIALWYW